MSRLIDADALKDKAFGGRKGLVHSSDIDAAPTVDAIPVEWMRNICAIAKMETDDEMFLEWLIQTWHQEQEVQDG